MILFSNLRQQLCLNAILTVKATSVLLLDLEHTWREDTSCPGRYTECLEAEPNIFIRHFKADTPHRPNHHGQQRVTGEHHIGRINMRSLPKKKKMMMMMMIWWFTKPQEGTQVQKEGKKMTSHSKEFCSHKCQIYRVNKLYVLCSTIISLILAQGVTFSLKKKNHVENIHIIMIENIYFH